MLSASTPAKLVLFGEWAVTKGFPAIATTLNKRFSATFNPVDFNKANEKPYLNLKAGLDNFYWFGQIVPISHFFYTVTQCLESLDYQHLLPGEIFYNCEWDIAEGLGSSGASFLSTFLLAAHHIKKDISKNELFEKVFTNYSNTIHDKASGLDIAAQINGNSIYFNKGNIQSIKIEFPKNLLVIHTGQKLDTNLMLDSIYPPKMFCDKISASVDDFLATRNWEKAIQEHHKHLHTLGVVPDIINNTLKLWKKNNWIHAAKTTGAGGGDALLVLANEDKINSLHASIKELGWWIQEAAFEAPGAILHEISKHESRSFT